MRGNLPVNLKGALNRSEAKLDGVKINLFAPIRRLAEANRFYSHPPVGGKGANEENLFAKVVNNRIIIFGKDKRTISEHIRNIFNKGKLEENMVVRNFRITTQHGAIEGKT
ncbi:hypothetical protein [Salinivirga cyanobacteriivorans]